MRPIQRTHHLAKWGIAPLANSAELATGVFDKNNNNIKHMQARLLFLTMSQRGLQVATIFGRGMSATDRPGPLVVKGTEDPTGNSPSFVCEMCLFSTGLFLMFA